MKKIIVSREGGGVILSESKNLRFFGLRPQNDTGTVVILSESKNLRFFGLRPQNDTRTVVILRCEAPKDLSFRRRAVSAKDDDFL